MSSRTSTNQPLTYRDLVTRLTAVYGDGEGRAMARRVMSDVFGLTLTDIVMGAADSLSADDAARLGQIVARLEQHEPLQYVVGHTMFCDHEFVVRPGVLIPRPETEQLVDMAVDAALLMTNGDGNEDNNPGHKDTAGNTLNVLDVCTGSGCIAISIALALRQKAVNATVTACDVSTEALSIARENATILNAVTDLVECDVLRQGWHNALPYSTYDIIVSNPPYICDREKADMDSNVLEHEPHLALFVPDNDPLLFYRHIASMALTTLTPGGQLMYEINRSYGRETADMLMQMGYSDVNIHTDIYDNPRFITATRT